MYRADKISIRFNRNKIMNDESYTIKWVQNNVVRIAKDPLRRSDLPEEFICGLPVVRRIILREATDSIQDIAVHKSGRVFLQTIIKSCEVDEISVFLDAFSIKAWSSCLFRMCVCEEGNLVIQVLIKNLRTDAQKQLFVSMLLPDVYFLTTIKTGSDVVSTCIYFLSLQHTLAILVVLFKHFMDIAGNKHGSRILQQCINKFADPVICGTFAERGIFNAKELAEDPHGAGVLECLINKEIPGVLSLVLDRIIDDMIDRCARKLCVSKGGSRIIKACIMKSSQVDLERIVYSLMDF